jgi:nitroreductase
MLGGNLNRAIKKKMLVKVWRKIMLEILRKRRSIRSYKVKDIDPRIVDQLKEAVLRSPSSRDIKPWRFIFVTNRDKLKRLSEAKESGSGFLKGARLGVVVAAEGDESDVWIEDCSIASIILQLAGLSLGLGSCWIQIRKRMHSDSQSSEDYVKGILGLSEKMRVESIISFGYPDEEKAPVPASKLDYHKISLVE